ncbi:MAG: dihydropteroate synthase [Chloroflexota bacterium]|nr:dihydropteroate synthase [Chloroflexota bacterium]MDE2895548.1 dihydropteroate synthase [Chloroflexota bacterium]
MELDAFPWGSRTLIVGILNVTPDSFAGDGVIDVAQAVATAEQMVRDGADIIDIGGESTRPGYQPVSTETEMERILPVLERTAAGLPETPISVDTTKPAVALAAFDAGAAMLNDINGLQGDPALADVAAARDAWVIAMHNQRHLSPAADPVATVLNGFRESLAIASRHGVDHERMILDPGFGFGWELSENAEILRRLSELRVLRCPILVGMSRKRMTGEQFGWGVEQRLEGSAAVTALAVANGADLVRVHDVAEMTRVVRMADDIVRQ